MKIFIFLLTLFLQVTTTAIAAVPDRMPPESNTASNGLIVFYKNPTKKQIDNWIKTYDVTCNKILRTEFKDELKKYRISSKIINNDIGLLYLILASVEIRRDNSRQQWLDDYNRMTRSQIYELYRILINEEYELNVFYDWLEKQTITIDVK